MIARPIVTIDDTTYDLATSKFGLELYWNKLTGWVLFDNEENKEIGNEYDSRSFSIRFQESNGQQGVRAE